MILVRFLVPGMTSGQYDALAGPLEASMTSARGFVAHAAGLQPNGDWEVTEFWESSEAWESFSRDVFMPKVGEMGGLPDSGA